MTDREQRGLELSKNSKIYRKGKTWFVPSQGGSSKYEVTLDPQCPKCNCPDHELRQVKCKHIFAVEFTLKRRTKIETDQHGNTQVIETIKLTKKVTYKQNWTAYNTAQTQEKTHFVALLHDLCRGIPQPPRTIGTTPGGRKPLPLRDMIFAATYKVYSSVSARRFMTDLTEAEHKGYLSKTPHFNSVLNYLERPDLTPVFTDLIGKSSLPLKSVETKFAVDASGFSTCKTVSWYDHRYGQSDHDDQGWLKAHIMTGVKTNVVSSVEVTGPFVFDGTKFKKLVQNTARQFAISEISADKGYSSHANLQVAADVGATPYIAFKSNTVERTGTGSIWEKMYGYFLYNREQFLDHYHQRSNVESTFSMIKANFGSHLKSKTQTAQVNELLCKVLAHNICVLIQAMFELKINPVF